MFTLRRTSVLYFLRFQLADVCFLVYSRLIPGQPWTVPVKSASDSAADLRRIFGGEPYFFALQDFVVMLLILRSLAQRWSLLLTARSNLEVRNRRYSPNKATRKYVLLKFQNNVTPGTWILYLRDPSPNVIFYFIFILTCLFYFYYTRRQLSVARLSDYFVSTCAWAPINR